MAPRDPDQRRAQILRLLAAHGTLRARALAAQLGVSAATLRADLEALEQTGALRRVHGGAVLPEREGWEPGFRQRERLHLERKRRLAERAAELVEDGDTIVLDGSTTVYQMADFLRARRHLTVVTNGIPVAQRLAENPTNTVLLTGGVLRPSAASLGGQLGARLLDGLRARVAFVSCSGLSFERGLADNDPGLAELKRELVAAAQGVVALVDSAKIDRPGLIPFASLARVAHLITDDALPPAQLERIRQAGLLVTICGERLMKVVQPRSARRYRLGFANANEEMATLVAMRQDLEQAVAEAGCFELLLADNRSDGPTALANAEYFVREGVDLVVELQTNERYGHPIMERFRSAGIPVISLGIPMPGAVLVGLDEYRAGLMAGEAAAEWVMAHWNGQVDAIVALELPEAGARAAARVQGQIDAVRARVALSDEQILRVDGHNTRNAGERVVRDLLPRLARARRVVVLALNDEGALGALDAFRAAGREEQAIAVGQGASRVALEEMARPGCRLVATVAHWPGRIGPQIVRLALDLLEGRPVPPEVYLPHRLITPASCEQALQEMREQVAFSLPGSALAG